MRTKQNFLTVDLEEWFVVEALTDKYSFDDWDELPSTLTENVHRLLRLFRSKGVRATWFVLGWSAERNPELMQQILGEGHEIACHSYRHYRVDKMSPDSFRKDTEMAIEAIRKATGVRPDGYRAPSWSMNGNIPWAFEILAELDFLYDSSIFPIKHDIYGMPDGPRRIFQMNFPSGRSIWELPASTYRILGRNLPIAGGGFLRHFPYWYTRRIVRKLNQMGEPANVYVHPWELDPNPPRIEGLTPLQKLRTYGSTPILAHKIERLLGDFEFIPIVDYLRSRKKKRIGFR